MNSRSAKRRKVKNKIKESPSEKRSREKADDVDIARNRLTGALNGILSSLEIDDYYMKTLGQKIDLASVKSGGDNQKYIMKICDRSVNLSQFKLSSPLYPMCREWIRNNGASVENLEEVTAPTNGMLEITHDADEYKEVKQTPSKIDNGDILSLPSPEPLPSGVVTLRIPSPVPHEDHLNVEFGTRASKDELLSSHINHWIKVRKKWRQAGQQDEARYEKTKELLTSMFDKTQMDLLQGIQ